MNHTAISIGRCFFSRAPLVLNAPLLAFSVCLVFTGCAEKKAKTPSENKPTDQAVAEAKPYQPTAVPSRPGSPFKNTHADVKYVGSETCRSCHDDVHARFFETRHSRSMSEVTSDDSTDACIRHEKSGFEYRTSVSDEGRLVHAEAVLLNGEARDTTQLLMDYVVGSGRFGRSYLSKQDGYLVQSPLTWYSDRKQWDMSPGYDFAGQFSFKRAVSAECLYCHSGTVDLIEDNEYHTVIHEQFVSCERCHGPGQLHVEKHQSDSAFSALANSTTQNSTVSDSDIDYSIVNPAKLSRELQESICQQCHLQADASVPVRGSNFHDFRPGLSLQRFRQDFRFGKSDDGMTIVGHVEQMHRSRCFQQTDSMTCATCHHPHAEATEIPRLEGYRNTCLQCHTDESCQETPQTRMTKAQNHCTICHMPSSPTEVPHVAFTHHRIGIHSRHSESANPSRSNAAPEVLAMVPGETLPAADQARVQGLATLIIYQTKPEAMNNGVLQSAREQLQKAWDGGAGDAVVAAGMANIAEIIGWPQMIDHWASTALDMNKQPSEARATALKVLSELRFRQGDYAQAYQYLAELTAIRRDSRAWFFRGLAAQNLGKTDDAIQSLLKSVNIDPRSHSAHTALAALFGVQKDAAKSDYHQQMAEGLAPSSR